MDLNELDRCADVYIDKAIANSTQRAYRTGARRFYEFCRLANLSPRPASERDLCRFVSHLASLGLKHRTIKVYLSGIRFDLLKAGLPNPFQDAVMTRLEYVLRGVKKVEAERGGEVRQRLPITPEILVALRTVWAPRGGEADTKMLWAACCIGFFRLSESWGDDSAVRGGLRSRGAPLCE